MSRSTAREHLFQLTFEQLFSEDKNDVTLEAYLMDASLTDSDKLYVRKAYDGIYSHLDELKGIVAKYSNGCRNDRQRLRDEIRPGSSRRRQYQRGGRTCQKIFHGKEQILRQRRACKRQ